MSISHSEIYAGWQHWCLNSHQNPYSFTKQGNNSIVFGPQNNSNTPYTDLMIIIKLFEPWGV
jgi:hypothetical protein